MHAQQTIVDFAGMTYTYRTDREGHPMGTRLHINAMHYPLPLVRDNSVVEVSSLYGGYTLSTDFGPEWDGFRTVFFGDDLDDLLRRLGEAGKVARGDDRMDDYWYIYHCDTCKDTRTVDASWALGKGATGTCGDCS